MDARFEDSELFQSRYQRNNKRGGLKNLRCFPTCATMHRERGFCGRMVVLRIEHPPKMKFAVFGEFVPVSDSSIGLKLNDTVTRLKALDICRDKNNPTKPWMEAEIIEDGRTFTRYAFNRDKKGWHYGWASNKHTCNASHALQAYVMQETNNEILSVKGVYQSPQFTLFCRRRRRFAMIPSAPIAPPNSKKRGNNNTISSPKKSKVDYSNEEEEEEEDEEDDDDTDKIEQVKKSRSKSSKRIITTTTSSKERKTKKVTMKPSKKITAVEIKIIDQTLPDDVKRKSNMSRIEKMLREISKRTIRATRPALQQQSRSNSPTELFSATDSASITTSEEQNNNNIAQEQFSLHLFECIDFFAGDSLLDDHVFESDDIMDFSSTSMKEKDKLVEELANYLLDEKGFTDAVYGLAKASKVQNNPNQESFDSFIQVLTNYLLDFLKSKSLTIEDFDQIFPDEQETPFQSGVELLLAQNTFQQIMNEEEDLKTSGPPIFDMEGVSKMNGYWILATNNNEPNDNNNDTIPTNNREEADDVESMRESLGYPWILRKMLNFMEEKFQVCLEGNVLSVRLQRKLFSSGAMKIILDGEEHDWGMKLPMFEGISNTWKYRAWVNEGLVHHVHDTGSGVNSRMRRTMFVDSSDCLRIEVSLEEFDSEIGKWETVAHGVQRAVRCD